MDEIEELKNRLIEQYTYYRTVVLKNYTYHSSAAHEKAFAKAAQFCLENNITPEEYAVALWTSLGDKKENFYPNYFGSPGGNRAALEYKEVAVTSPEIQLEYQKKILHRHVIELGNDPVEVLMNPRIKFYAWFRILATKTPEPEIMRTYGTTARAEMTPELAKYLESQNLEISRL
jgi:hypothetical protein